MSCALFADFEREQAAADASSPSVEASIPTSPSAGIPTQPPAFYAFPTVEQLQAATEADLRQHGFGYRARYIVETVRMLAARPEGEGANAVVASHS